VNYLFDFTIRLGVVISTQQVLFFTDLDAREVGSQYWIIFEYIVSSITKKHTFSDMVNIFNVEIGTLRIWTCAVLGEEYICP